MQVLLFLLFVVAIIGFDGEGIYFMYYTKLEINFEIPELLQDSINDFIVNLNEHNGNLADCYVADIRNTLNGCEECLTPEQIDMLRQYYCRGGIYNHAD